MAAAWAIEHSDQGAGMRMRPMLTLSVIFHLAVFCVFLFAPGHLSTRSVEGVVYEVSLVEMPPEGNLKPQKSAPAKEEKEKGLAIKDVEAKRIGSLKQEEKPVIIAKRALKEKTLKREKPEVSPSELIDRAISRIETKVKTEESHDLEKAISRLESKVDVRSGSEVTGGPPSAGIPIRMYQMEVENRIKGNWAYPVAFQSQKNLEAVVVLQVKRNGTIMKTEIKKRSSNPIFDQSVIKAIEKSDPLPPFPEWYKKSYDEIEINFNLKDLQG